MEAAAHQISPKNPGGEFVLWFLWGVLWGFQVSFVGFSREFCGVSFVGVSSEFCGVFKRVLWGEFWVLWGELFFLK